MKVIFNSILIVLFLLGVSFTNREENDTLLKLMNKRLEVAVLVAKSKWNTKAPIDDPVREKIILDSVKNKAKKMGIDENLALDFFQAQFVAGKLIQRQLHKEWQTENRGPFEPNVDLKTEVRPVLDSLTPLLLLELKKLKPNSGNVRLLKRLKKDARKIINSNFNDEVVETAIKPIENYSLSK
jgi:chorismate mutase